jgi:hypothetical protein
MGKARGLPRSLPRNSCRHFGIRPPTSGRTGRLAPVGYDMSTYIDYQSCSAAGRPRPCSFFFSHFVSSARTTPKDRGFFVKRQVAWVLVISCCHTNPSAPPHHGRYNKYEWISFGCHSLVAVARRDGLYGIPSLFEPIGWHSREQEQDRGDRRRKETGSTRRTDTVKSYHQEGHG